MRIQSIKENITLENVKKSNYWDLLAILIWNHYNDPKYQEGVEIQIYENWYGVGIASESHSAKWDSPGYSEGGYVRTLNSIVIKLIRSDYTVFIHIRTSGNITCYGFYNRKEEQKQPYFSGIQRNMEQTNWLLQNNFVEVV